MIWPDANERIRGPQSAWIERVSQATTERTENQYITEAIPTIRHPIGSADSESSVAGYGPQVESHTTRPYFASGPFTVRVSVVIPALNERENLPHVLPWIPSWVYEVVLVDGHSVDGTVEVARKLRPDIRVVTQPGEGKGDALRAGFAVATGDIIVMMDADGSTNPQEIPAFVGALLAGADFAKGSRFMQGGGTADMPFVRRFGHGALLSLVRLAFGCKFSDLCYGYNAFWAYVLPDLHLDADGFEIETLMNVRALKAGLRVVEVHSFEEKRAFGEGRLRAIPDGWRVLKTILKERFVPTGEPLANQCRGQSSVLRSFAGDGPRRAA